MNKGSGPMLSKGTKTNKSKHVNMRTEKRLLICFWCCNGVKFFGPQDVASCAAWHLNEGYCVSTAPEGKSNKQTEHGIDSICVVIKIRTLCSTCAFAVFGGSQVCIIHLCFFFHTASWKTWKSMLGPQRLSGLAWVRAWVHDSTRKRCEEKITYCKTEKLEYFGYSSRQTILVFGVDIFATLLHPKSPPLWNSAFDGVVLAVFLGCHESEPQGADSLQRATSAIVATCQWNLCENCWK